MLKTVVIVVGCVGILLGITPQPSARAQVTTVAVPFADAPTATDAAQADARANALKALKEAQSKIDCTFALQMKEVDPDADPEIHVPAPRHGDAKIRRILPTCRVFAAVQRSKSLGSVIVKPKARDEADKPSEKPVARER